MFRFLAMAALIAGICGCGDPQESTDELLLDDQTWEADLVRRIGSIDDPSETLTRVTQVVLGPTNGVYVSQPDDARVLLYNDNPTTRSIIGRRGQGPGEFEWLGTIGIVGDTLYASDSHLGRVSLFSLDGRFVRSAEWVLPPPEPPTPQYFFGTSTPDLLLEDGTALLRVSLALPFPANYSERGAYRWTIPQWYVRISRVGSILNTLTRFELYQTTLRVTPGSSGFTMRNPFEYGPLSELMADGSGVVVAERRPATDMEPSAFQVTVIDPAGETTFSSAVRFQPAELTADDVRHFIEMQDRLYPSHVEILPVSEREQALRSEGLIPATRIPVAALTTGQDGTIWLKGPETPHSELASWTVLDGKTGELRGSLQLPRSQDVIAAKGDHIVTHELDDLDVPYLAVYRIRR